MLRHRLIPVLLLRNGSLVKTVRFGKFQYIGDPCNTVRIFNELEVDELVMLDITATNEGRTPDLRILADVASECFMPLGYGGGIRDVETARRILQLGIEKIAVNSAAIADPGLVSQLSQEFGSQAVVVSIDVGRDLWGHRRVVSHSGRRPTKLDIVEWAQRVEELGAGEILLTSIEREGTWSGLDLDLMARVTSSVSLPVIAHGGVGSVRDVADAIDQGGASAVAVGSMVVFQKQGMGVLVNFPEQPRGGWGRQQ